jgi:hypothetical protein
MRSRLFRGLRPKDALSIVAFTLAFVGVSAFDGFAAGPLSDCPREACDRDYHVCVMVDIDSQCKDGARAGDDCTGSERCGGEAVE